ncbi:hypothetical protein A2U01_0097287 [Trifolium medium]|nr:hypothetical protein [Trifolium medium]
MVVGGKIFMRAEDIPRDEGEFKEDGEQHGGSWDHHRFKGKVENC